MQSFNTLQQWLDWQETLHPTEIELGLERIRVVWQRLYSDQFPGTVITVAGTNGKGSCCAMLESIYRKSGYRVGCYTSPHLLRYNERIRIDGEAATDDAICRAFEAVEQARADTSLTYFEFGTLAALWLFVQAQPDVTILEVGMGGRLDAVNIIDADAVLLTPIGIDHSDWLGPDRESIGREKAGVLRAGQAAVCVEAQPPQSVIDVAADLGTRLYRPQQDFEVTAADATSWIWRAGPDSRHALPHPALRGMHQLDNAAAVLMLVHLLSSQLPVSQDHLRQGLSGASLAGRFQVVQRAPDVIVDVAHNPQAVEALQASLRAYGNSGQCRLVLGMMRDKDVVTVLRCLRDTVDHWYLASPAIARAMPVEQLSAQVQALSDNPVQSFAEIGQAVAQALADAASGDVIVITGSFYTVAEALRWLQAH